MVVKLRIKKHQNIFCYFKVLVTLALYKISMNTLNTYFNFWFFYFMEKTENSM